MRTVTVLVALGAAAALAACSSSTSGSGAGSGSPAAPTSAASQPVSTPAPASSAPAPSSAPASASAPANTLSALLLTSADLGTGFVQAQSNPPGPLPCTPTQPPVTEQVHNVGYADAVFVKQAGGPLQFEETVYAYGTTDDAIKHQQIDEQGLACSSGTVSGTKITIAGPTDLQSSLTAHTEKAEAWSVGNATIKGALVIARLANNAVVELSFLAAANVTPPNNIPQLIDKALAKVISGH
jgi:hypothetical protein